MLLIDFPLFRTFRLKLGQLLALRFEGLPGIPGGEDGSYQQPPSRHIAPLHRLHDVWPVLARQVCRPDGKAPVRFDVLPEQQSGREAEADAAQCVDNQPPVVASHV